MREIQLADAEGRLSQIVGDVERGETIVLTREGRAIARISPEVEDQETRVRRIFSELDALRRTAPKLTLEDLLSARHEGHRF